MNSNINVENNNLMATIDEKPGGKHTDHGIRNRLRAMSSGTISFVTITLLVVLWAALTSFGIVSTQVASSPGGLSTTFIELLSEGYAGYSLGMHVVASLGRALAGFTIGLILGVPTGLFIGRSVTARAILEPVLSLIRPIPPIAYLPLFVLWFGLGEVSRILLVALTAFLYIVLGTVGGAQAISDDLETSAQMLGASRLTIFMKVVFPASLPHIFTGMKTALALSWSVLVAAELLGAQQGIGFMIQDGATFFNLDVVFLGIVISGLLGYILVSILEISDKRLNHWVGK